MSAWPSNLAEMGYHGLIMTADEYLALGETSERYELINGVVVMSPSPRPLHAKVLLQVGAQVQRFEDAGGAIDAYTETDLRIDPSTVYEPDLIAYARPLPKPIPERLTTPPELIVEVLSPRTEPLDLITKRAAYERFGVREYWVIDADAGTVRVWRSEGGRLVEAAVTGTTVPCKAIPGFALDLAPLARLARHAT